MTEPVCSGGELELLCITGRSFLQWSYILPMSGVQRNIYIVDSVTPTLVPHLQTVNSSIFNISRTTPYDTLPLMSRLLISPVNDSLNGTVIICQEIGTDNSSLISVKVISTEELGIQRRMEQSKFTASLGGTD